MSLIMLIMFLTAKSDRQFLEKESIDIADGFLNSKLRLFCFIVLE